MAEEMEEPLGGVVVNVVSGEVHAGSAAPLCAGAFVEIGLAATFHQRPGTHVRTTNPEDDDFIDLVPHPGGRIEDFSEFAVGAIGLVGVKRSLGQFVEPGIEGLFCFGNVGLGCEKFEVAEDFVACGQQLGLDRIDLG